MTRNCKKKKKAFDIHLYTSVASLSLPTWKLSSAIVRKGVCGVKMNEKIIPYLKRKLLRTVTKYLFSCYGCDSGFNRLGLCGECTTYMYNDNED